LYTNTKTKRASARFFYGHGRPVCRSAGAPGTGGHFPHPCGSQTQEQFLTAMDGVNAENAGAIFGRRCDRRGEHERYRIIRF
jgi:hypothetical protein